MGRWKISDMISNSKKSKMEQWKIADPVSDFKKSNMGYRVNIVYVLSGRLAKVEALSNHIGSQNNTPALTFGHLVNIQITYLVNIHTIYLVNIQKTQKCIQSIYRRYIQSISKQKIYVVNIYYLENIFCQYLENSPKPEIAILLAPQSGALRISAFRDFQSHPIPTTYSF